MDVAIYLRLGTIVLPPSVYIFYGIKVYKQSIFLTSYHPSRVNVVCERPLVRIAFKIWVGKHLILKLLSSALLVNFYSSASRNF
jgi:hypothetical protein